MAEPATRPAESEQGSLPLVHEGQTVAGKYLVGPLLGVGGMGVVHSARDILLDRRVALKVLSPRLLSSRTAGERFLREARAATRITSEHVVKLLESDTLPDGTPLLVMEYLEGRDLRALLREDGPLPPERAVDHLLQALQAIAEGHVRGIVHRDVKPSNLFLTERADGTPLIKVLDFGIAKTLESDRAEDFALTNSEDTQLGSPIYMPPEQLRNPRDVDARADIWALGVTLYELISGKQPFRGQSHADLVSQVLHATPEALATPLALSLPAGLQRVVARCLEKQRHQRYADAAELAVALAPFGSEDARLSLSRVTGLSRSRVGAATSLAPGSANDDPTLPVTADPAPARSAGTSLVRKIASDPNRGSGRALGALATVAILGSVIWFGLHASRPRPVAALPRADIQAVPTQAAPAQTAATPAIATQTSANVVSAPLTQPAKRARVSGAKALALPSPHKHGASSGTSTDSTETKPPAAAPTAGDVGPSALIESLIEQRH
ncbi:MAG TPA: serine/threonine-protein kinase [Polyangiaceae bacterium]